MPELVPQGPFTSCLRSVGSYPSRARLSPEAVLFSGDPGDRKATIGPANRDTPIGQPPRLRSTRTTPNPLREIDIEMPS